jgi:hypothetical protein
VHAGADRRDAGGQEGAHRLQVGVRESAQSWRELLVEVKSRGITIAPEIAVGDGALGFWKALDEVFPGTRHQRCWVHKTANVLNKSHTLGADHMKKDLLLDRRLPLEMFPSISLHLDVAALSHRSADEFGGRVTDSAAPMARAGLMT